MATTSTHLPVAGAGRAVPASAGRANLAGALRSEFTKIRSVRSTYWTLFTLVVVTVGFGALASLGVATHGHPGPGFDATAQSLSGLYISQLIMGVLGVLVITAEYSTGMIRTTLMTLPRRGTVIAAKAIVFAVVAFVTGLITSFASFFLGQALMSSHHISTTISQPHVLRAVIGGALFLTACGLLAFGIGLLLRHTAGAISTVVALLFVLSILINFIPQSWQNHVDKWVPAMAGTRIWSYGAQPGRDADVRAVDRVCGVLRVRSRRAHRGAGAVPQAGRVGSPAARGWLTQLDKTTSRRWSVRGYYGHNGSHHARSGDRSGAAATRGPMATVGGRWGARLEGRGSPAFYLSATRRADRSRWCRPVAS